MDPSLIAFIATVWLAGAAIFVLVVLPNCPRSDDDPVEPVSRNLRNIHNGSDTVSGVQHHGA